MNPFQNHSSVHTAVILPVHLENNDDDTLETPLLKPTASTPSSPTKTLMAANVLFGSLIGMAVSMLGCHILLYQHSTYDNSTAGWLSSSFLSAHPQVAIGVFALAWSLTTGFVAYALFRIMHVWCLATPECHVQRLEYALALGVFVGFSAMCTVTDLRMGLPLSRIALILGAALVWTLALFFLAATTARAVEEAETTASAKTTTCDEDDQEDQPVAMV